MKQSDVLSAAQETLAKKKELINYVRSYKVNPIGKVEVSVDDYKEIIEGILVKDITSYEQFTLGITVLHVKSHKEVDFGKHDHEKQSQVIYVMKGQVCDLQSSLLFYPGQSFLVPKANVHTIRYFPATEAIIVYMPKLYST